MPLQVAALVPQLEVDEPQCGSSRDLQSRIMMQALRKIHYSLCNSSTLIIFINQVRTLLPTIHLVHTLFIDNHFSLVLVDKK